VNRGDERRCARCRALLRRGNAGTFCEPCSRSADSGHITVLPVDFYDRPEIVAALAAYDFGSLFKAARAELHMSQEQFGHLVDLGQSRVCKVENGGQRLRDIATVARLASILRTPAELLGFTTDPDSLEWATRIGR